MSAYQTCPGSQPGKMQKLDNHATALCRNMKWLNISVMEVGIDILRHADAPGDSRGLENWHGSCNGDKFPATAKMNFRY